MKRRNLSLLITLVLVLALLAGCGNKQTAPEETKAPEAAQTQASTPAAEEVEDLTEIKMIYMPLSSMPKGLQEVEDAVNAITEAEINVHVDIEIIESGNYDSQIGLMMAGNEPIDVFLTFPVGATSYSAMVNQNQFMDISALLPEYAPELLETVGELINATTVAGKVYAIPTYRSLVVSSYLCMRTDVLEDLGLLEKAQNMTTFTEYEEILEAVKASEKWNYLAGVVNSDLDGLILPMGGAYLGVDKFEDASSYDQLGDATKLIAVDPYGNDSTVKLNFETPEYKAMVDMMRGWYEKGYIYKDAATTEDPGETLIKNNVGFSYFTAGEIGVEANKSVACGTPMTCIKLETHPISTGSCTKFAWAVPSTSTEPEAAVKFLNMMFTDARIENLLLWGIEGRDYQLVDGVACFVGDQDANSVAYQMGEWQFGNQFLAYPWDGQPADIREQAKAEMDVAEESVFLGFSCDTTNIQTELAALANVIAEYTPTLDSGLAPEGTYEEFIEKLYDMGAQKVVDEYQKQLDAWIAANK